MERGFLVRVESFVIPILCKARRVDRIYHHAMTRELNYQPPQIEFDDGLARQLARPAGTTPAAPIETATGYGQHRSPFAGYARILTPAGGFLIHYRDRLCGWPYTLCRLAAWSVLTILELRWLSESDLSFGAFVMWFIILGAAALFLVTRKIKRRHSVEIRHDRMILDAKDVFWAQDIGSNFPKLQQVDDDPDRFVIAGICGTRWIEYMTVNRVDANDRTPEVLAADLQNAMQQLWGRNELVFG